MKHKVSELEGALLDAAVAKAEGLRFRLETWRHDPPGHGPRCFADWTPGAPPMTMSIYSPSHDWYIGGPIIERERITVQPWPDNWAALWYGPHGTAIGTTARGPTPLIAAMRAYVASKVGEEIDL